MARNSQGTVDLLDFTDVFDRQGSEGVKLTFVIPTSVTGQDDSVSVLTLKNQLREAKAQLLAADMGESEADKLLDSATALLGDSSYWRLQSRSLIIFVADGFFRPVRIPIELPASLTVGPYFNVLPIAPVLASDSKLYILALAKNSVRLFNSTRNIIEEMPLEGIPASFDEVIEQLPERVVDVRAGSAGTGGTPSFQGPNGDIDRTVLEEYIYAVGQAVGKRLGTARSQLLVLASVAEYLPIFQDACPYPAIFDGVIRGNPEAALPDDLRSDAWALVNNYEHSREEKDQDQARSQAHAGKGSLKLSEITDAAENGRVATLLLSRDDAHIQDEADRALANRALIGTLQNSGTLRTVDDLDGNAIATFRY